MVNMLLYNDLLYTMLLITCSTGHSIHLSFELWSYDTFFHSNIQWFIGWEIMKQYSFSLNNPIVKWNHNSLTNEDITCGIQRLDCCCTHGKLHQPSDFTNNELHKTPIVKDADNSRKVNHDRKNLEWKSTHLIDHTKSTTVNYDLPNIQSIIFNWSFILLKTS